MPNWCHNVVTFNHTDTAQIARISAAFNEDRLMQEFHPCPQALVDTPSMYYPDTMPAQQAAQATLEAANMQQYGFATWHDWKTGNWGTKWDPKSDNKSNYVEGDNSITLDFDTAWSPPIEFFDAMTALDFEVLAFYYEPGVSFCGCYSDGANSEHHIDGDSAWVAENIPEDIEDTFNIVVIMQEWEAEAEAEEEEG